MTSAQNLLQLLSGSDTLPQSETLCRSLMQHLYLQFFANQISKKCLKFILHILEYMQLASNCGKVSPLIPSLFWDDD